MKSRSSGFRRFRRLLLGPRDATSSNIVANDYSTGRAMVELKEGDFFKTSGCNPWTAQTD